MSIFSSIPVRVHGSRVNVSWWNTIRTKLILYAGAGAIEPTEIDITNGQSATAISGFSFDGDTYRSFECKITVHRVTDSVEVASTGYVKSVFKSTGWSDPAFSFDHEEVGLTFTMSDEGGNVGALNVAATTLSGSGHVGKLTIDAVTRNVAS